MGNDLLNDLAVDSDNLSLEGLANEITGTTSSAETVTETTASNNTVSNSVESSDNYTLTLDRPTFSKMINSLKIIENICNDCEIRHGIIRTKSDNRKVVIVADMTSIIQDKNLMFSFLKGKLNLLKTFELDMNVQAEDNNIIIQANNDNYEFSDCFSKLQFRKPMSNFLDNVYMEDNDFQNIIGRATEDTLIFTYTVDNYVKQRLSKICEGFRVDSVKFDFHGDHATLGVETKSKDDISKNATQIQLLQNIDNKYFTMINLPFTLAIDSELKINCYKISNDRALCKCELNYLGIPFVIYAMMKFVDSAS